MIVVDPHQVSDPKILEDRIAAVLLAAKNFWRAHGWSLPEAMKKKAGDAMLHAAQEYSSAMDVEALMASMRGEQGPQPTTEFRDAMIAYDLYRQEVCRYKNRHATMTAACEVCEMAPVGAGTTDKP
jgi:hypothetical protein